MTNQLVRAQTFLSRRVKKYRNLTMKPSVISFRKVIFLFIAAIGSIGSLRRLSAETTTDQVSVTYAVVPKARLSDAVKGKQEALEIENSWRQATGTDSRLSSNARFIGTQYSIVIFVDNSPGSSIKGQIAIPIQGTTNSRSVNVLLAAGFHGTYVIDGGGIIMLSMPDSTKPFRWVDFQSY